MTSRQAMQRSIRKWEGVCFDGRQREPGSETACSLCSYHDDMFYEDGEDCYVNGGCPLALITNKIDCRGTPYYNTSNWDVNKKPGIYSDYHMLMLLYMLWHEYYA